MKRIALAWALVVSGVIGLAVGRDARAAAPSVQNVVFAQRQDGSGIVDVTYDLYDADSSELTISLQASDDGGASWIVPCNSVAGDAGDGIAPGTGKHLTWNFKADDNGWEGAAYRVRVIASDTGVSHKAHSPARYAIFQWAMPDWNDPALVEEYARADLLVMMTGQMWGYAPAESLHFYDKVKEINPDCVVTAYQPAKQALLIWELPEAPPYFHTWYERTLPYWAWTTEGDTVQDFPGNVHLNILKPECRQVMLETLEEFQSNSNNPLDGIFWDFFGVSFWAHPDVELIGDPDFDEDGVGYWDDPDEQAAFLAAQDSLVVGLRAALGDDYIQIFNGSRARVDSVFAETCDGFYYERFPTLWPFNYSMATALDPAFNYNVFRTRHWPRQQNGGPYVLLGNIMSSYYVDYNGEPTLLDSGNQFRVVGLLTDSYSAWLAQGAHVYRWPDNEISLGPPLGPVQIEGNVFSRDFRYGRVEMTMENGDYPDPFSYRIWVNGVLVEELNTPYHFP
jgi:hypothetical protein